MLSIFFFLLDVRVTVRHLISLEPVDTGCCRHGRWMYIFFTREKVESTNWIFFVTRGSMRASSLFPKYIFCYWIYVVLFILSWKNSGYLHRWIFMLIVFVILVYECQYLESYFKTVSTHGEYFSRIDWTISLRITKLEKRCWY